MNIMKCRDRYIAGNAQEEEEEEGKRRKKNKKNIDINQCRQ